MSGSDGRGSGAFRSVLLPSDAAAPGAARRQVRRTLAAWGLSRLAEPCELAATELVTNAIRHGEPPVTLDLECGSRDVRLSVHDAGSATPVWSDDEGPAGQTDEVGRGLAIVAAVSDLHGVVRLPGNGKRMFATWLLPATR